MVVDVNDTDAQDFQSSLIIPDTAWPEVTNPRCLMTGLGDIGRSDGDSFSFACEMLADDRGVERKLVESFILKKVTVCLFRKTSIPAQLEEVYTIQDGHE